jgi:hypothetical protein
MEIISTGILVLLVILTGFLAYREKYPSGVVIKDPPILKLEQGSPIPVTGFPADIPLSNVPKTIEMVTPSSISLKTDPLQIDYGNSPQLRVADVAPISITGFPANIPLSNVPKTIEMVAPSSIPLRAEPLLVNYGNAPQLHVADIPNLKVDPIPPIPLMKINPCEGMSGKFRGVGPECASFIWQDSGCVAGRRPYTEWDKKRTKDELYTEYGHWATLQDSWRRTGCYGENWQDYVSNPPEVFILMGPNGEYMPPSYWDPILQAKGWPKATSEQLTEAQKLGAEWCASAIIANGSNRWPRQTATQACGGPPIAIWTPADGSGGVTVFARKPVQSQAQTSQYRIIPFNTDKRKWSQFD